MQLAAAEDGMRGSAQCCATLPRDRAGLLPRLESERDKQGQRHAQLHQLLSRVNQFLAELPHGTVLVEEASPVVELKPGGTLSAAMSGVRPEIGAVGQQLARVKAALLPAADQKKLAENYTVELIRLGGGGR
jgi:hypothetical protein